MCYSCSWGTDNITRDEAKNVRKIEKAAERRRYQLQGVKNGPEVLFWEQTLGMRIKGMGVPDKIRIIFSNLSERKYDEEYTFALDLSAKDYEGKTWHYSSSRTCVYLTCF